MWDIFPQRRKSRNLRVSSMPWCGDGTGAPARDLLGVRSMSLPRFRRGLGPALLCGVIAAVVVACGGGGGSEVQDPPPGSPALKPSRPGDLTAYVQRVLRERAEQRAAGNNPADASRTVVALPVGAAVAAPSATPAFANA